MTHILRTMLDHIIADRTDEAEETLHQYVVAKSRGETIEEAKKKKRLTPDEIEALVKKTIGKIPFDVNDHDGDTLEFTIDRSDVPELFGDDDVKYDEMMVDIHEKFGELSAILKDHGIDSDIDSDSGDPQFIVYYRDEDSEEDDD